MVGIYKITNPKGKVYIGQSIDINRRKRVYKTMNCKRQYKIYASLLKYGWNNHKFEVVCECLREELNDLEVYYINLYQSLNSSYGLNLRDGGTSLAHSEETKRKISKANKGRKMTAEQRKKLSDAWKTRIVSEETKKKISDAAKGRFPTQETRKKLSESHKKRYSNEEWSLKFSGAKNPFYGKNHTEETRKRLSEVAKNRSKELLDKMAKKNRIKINQYTIDGNFIKEWSSATEAGRCLGIDNGDIGKVCKGKYKQAKGFVFKYGGIGLAVGMNTTLGNGYSIW